MKEAVTPERLATVKANYRRSAVLPAALGIPLRDRLAVKREPVTRLPTSGPKGAATLAYYTGLRARSPPIFQSV